MLKAANACRFWPTGRGIYHNDAKTFLVWCNEEDHLRIISMQMGGDLGQVLAFYIQNEEHKFDRNWQIRIMATYFNIPTISLLAVLTFSLMIWGNVGKVKWVIKG
jgi:hypothetical protein